jgi:hypothetical protein
MRHSATAVALVLATAPALAQESTSPPDASRLDAAQTYVDSEALQTTLDELLSTDIFMAQLRASGMSLDPGETTTLAQIVDEEFSGVRPEIEGAMVTAAAETFTLEELDALNAFYGSEEGRSIAAKTAPFMQTFYDEITPTLSETQQRIAARAQETLGPGTGGATPPTVTE